MLSPKISSLLLQHPIYSQELTVSRARAVNILFSEVGTEGIGNCRPLDNIGAKYIRPNFAVHGIRFATEYIFMSGSIVYLGTKLSDQYTTSFPFRESILKTGRAMGVATTG